MSRGQGRDHLCDHDTRLERCQVSEDKEINEQSYSNMILDEESDMEYEPTLYSEPSAE